MTATAVETKTWKWGPGAWAALTSDAPYVDLEGGVRAQKTTVLCAKVLALCLAHPGIKCFLGRWTEESLDTQIKPKWREHCSENGIALKWNAEEHYDQLENGSIVYMRGLKPSEGAARYSKIRGLTLAFIGIDQAEEVPPDFWAEFVARVSQPGMPHQIWLTPQPVNPGHWIDDTFPEDNRDPRYFYVRTNVYDNRAAVGDEYIAGLEKQYLPGSAQRRTLLEGRRGLATSGRPVYQGIFDRRRHVKHVTANKEIALYEGWDYGHSHPCVVWANFTPMGRLAVLGGVMGKDMSIDQFAPVALYYRELWFGKQLEVQSTGDPAGIAESSQGLPGSVPEILDGFGVQISGCTGGNAPEIRDRAIKSIASYMNRVALDGGPAFVVSERGMLIQNGADPKPMPFLADGFEAGYVWDERQFYGPRVNIRRPKKDGTYDHGQNCVEYIVLAFGPGMPSQDDLDAHERLMLRRSQRDDDSVTRPTASTSRLRRG